MGGIEVIDRRGGGSREVDPAYSVHYPDTAGRLEAWSDTLGWYPGGSLARANTEYAEKLRATGWLHRPKRNAAVDDPEDHGWEAPPKQKRSVEQAAKIIRRAVDQLDPRDPPPYMPRPVVQIMVGIVQGLGDLLFYADIEEPWAAATLELAEIAGRQRREDPERTLFRDAGHVLAVAAEDAARPLLGAGSPNYHVAESRGRTRAHWHEVECKPTHVTAGHVRNLGDVERAIDAQRSAERARLDPVDRAGLEDWLRDRARPETRVLFYRRRLAATRGHGIRFGAGLFDVTVSDVEARAATEDLTDKDILNRLTKAKGILERHLRRLAPKADEMALATGDKAFLAPLAPPARPRGERAEGRRPPRAPRPPVEPICSPAPRCM
ncbi:hypothetical protein [Sorangium sp. So ce233]|uniref:hypothetical protein n=1 Tax=Sorangium sp. So ce233 TaxID=3133290 RepID=UPI003F642F8F